ncbi:hypothetical protein KCP70_17220 [Salmonella enterica subsp. enterica]|nr:hypothetical protein KCP70_17220 [Salmonella enterica subsp. enterica]
MISEGGSGGALAVAWVIKVDMLQYSTYSVISRKVAPLACGKSADKAPWLLKQ